jgi:hypothetical protein
VITKLLLITVYKNGTQSNVKIFTFIFLQAALIGAGASVIGVASDVAGSIRVPAMFNGIFSHKPTPGRGSCIRTNLSMTK